MRTSFGRPVARRKEVIIMRSASASTALLDAVENRTALLASQY